MGNQSGTALDPGAIVRGRRPNDHEMIVLYQLQRLLFTRLVESPDHVALLKRYWDSHFVNKLNAPRFERPSPFWSTEGGCMSNSPGPELRSSGELGLQCLVFFAETYPAECRTMKRAKGGYPFVKTAVALVRALSEVFHLVDEYGERGKFPIVETLYWHLIESERDFYTIFSLCFVFFEELYCNEMAQNRMLPVTEQTHVPVVTDLVDATKARLLVALAQGPRCVEDLRFLCKYANQIINLGDRASGTHTECDSIALDVNLQESTPSRWKQHHADRKYVQDVLQNNWGNRSFETSNLSVDNTGGAAPRLHPRSPEIKAATSHFTDISSLSTGQPTIEKETSIENLFAGLATKTAAAKNGDTQEHTSAA